MSMIPLRIARFHHQTLCQLHHTPKYLPGPLFQRRQTSCAFLYCKSLPNKHQVRSRRLTSKAESAIAMANGQKDESGRKIAQDMLDFINASVTQFHAVGRAPYAYKSGFLQSSSLIRYMQMTENVRQVSTSEVQ